jgi:serine protease Do
MRLRARGFSLIALAITLMVSGGVSTASAQADPKGLLRALEGAFVDVAEKVTPAVVHVSARQKAKPQEEGQPRLEERFKDFFGEEFMERFFRRRPPRESPGVGSGVIVDSRGYILTNNHVVERADQIEVRLSDQRKFTATVVGTDPKTDLAVLKINATDSLPVAPLGDSSRLRIGQWAVAIGNPFGLDRTVTAGIISATGRARMGVATYENFIQTDASINPGNSGGPLLNLDGQVIGINTAIVSVGQGIGFAIPINMAKEIMQQLIDRGRVVRGWLGVVIQDLSDDLAQGFGVPPRSGVLVADVMKDGPAEAAGVKPGDIIVEFSGQTVREVPELQQRVASVPPGKATPVTVLRDKRREVLTIKVGEMPLEETRVALTSDRELGIRVEPITPELTQRFNLTATSGVVVTEVEHGSPGDLAGIREGDVILEVNRKKITDPGSFRQALASLAPSEPALIYLQREGRGQYLVMRGPEAKP